MDGRRYIAVVLAALVALTSAGALADAGKPELAASFVGAKTCGTCHARALAVWQQSAHAKANANLPQQNRSDARCLRCHGTSDERVGGVQCEHCHGSGKIYARRHVMRDRVLSRLVGLIDASLEKCGRCHTATGPRIMQFSSGTAWQRIAHGREPAPAKESPVKKDTQDPRQ